MYKNILIPVVFDSEHDHKRALQIASLAGPDAKVTLLHVIEQLPTYVISYVPEGTSKQLRAELQAEMDKLTKDLPNATGEIITGHSGRSITNYAEKNGMDLIVVESHRPGFGDYFLGSTAGHIVRHATCSVHVIR
ncbi:universal stress protein [Roseovarius sp. S4756]|uniref:universal stress protein n=1 Tax=Roseovarius maritimus TaxID=3342637 RepID=UPI0037271500